MWTEEKVDYAGTYYQLQGAISNPKPVQGSIPMWVAGGGEQLTLRVAAKYADYTNFGLKLDAFIHKSEVLQGHCRDLGRDYDEIVRSAMFSIVIDEDAAVVADKLGEYEARLAHLVGSEKAARSRQGLEENGLVGTPEQAIEKLRPWRDAGAGYVIGYFPDAAYDGSSVDLFAKAVMPNL
jgi:alkanesulfonate monooxygenase SsuD/methylene tetrahydromethanopterin reductase-like flavin-dependent oxidoreductase (luciferase family)